MARREETAEYWKNREMAKKYGTQLFMSECAEIPGEIIYEDEFQIAIKNQRTDICITTEKI